MAGFKTHVSVSGGIGIIFGTAGYACGLPPATAAVGAALCTLGGMLPDLDGDTGVAVREIVPLLAAAVPILMLDVFKHWGLDREGTFLAILAIYFLIRFGVGVPFKKLTRHRGMWHSIPAAINVGLICMIICSYQELGPRVFKASAIALGFISHLVLDEIWSIDLAKFRIKRSLGTAFKFFSRKRAWPNILTYGLMAIFIGILSSQNNLQGNYQAWRTGEMKINLIPDLSRFQLSTFKGEMKQKEDVRSLPVSRPSEVETGSDGGQLKN